MYSNTLQKTNKMKKLYRIRDTEKISGSLIIKTQKPTCKLKPLLRAQN